MGSGLGLPGGSRRGTLRLLTDLLQHIPPHPPHHGRRARPPRPNGPSVVPEAPAAAQQQPESLTGLPLAWLRRLVTSWDARCSLEVLVRTCTAMRDMVLESMRLTARADLPVPEEQFQGVLGRLCVAARRSRNVRLLFYCHGDEPWSITEGSAASLLQSAVGQLGGPLTGVVEVIFKVMEVECVAPQWLAAACPDVHSITLDRCPVARGGEEHGGEDMEGSEEADGEEEAVEQQQQHQEEEQDPPAPLAFQRLQALDLRSCSFPPLASPGGARLCRQLRALTTLRSLEMNEVWDFTHPSLVSSNVTELVYDRDVSPGLTSLPVQFPAVRELSVHFLTLDDGDLDAVLSLASLRVLHVVGFALRRSHAQQRCALDMLKFDFVDVDALSRLPWSGIQACRGGCSGMTITCSGNAQATAAVAAALQQRSWDADEFGELCVVNCHSSAVLEATLPLMAMMRPSDELYLSNSESVSATVLQRLGHLAPVRYLSFWQCSLTEDAWPALLPALPHASRLVLSDVALSPTEQQLLALCQSATRPVRVELSGGPPSDDDADALCQRVMQAAGNGRVTLTWRAY